MQVGMLCSLPFMPAAVDLLTCRAHCTMLHMGYIEIVVDSFPPSYSKSLAMYIG